MVLEKKGSTEQIREEKRAEGQASETVLDYLWHPDAAHDLPAGEQARHAAAPDARSATGAAQHAPIQDGAGQDSPSADELKDVLARYASWLNSWSGHD